MKKPRILLTTLALLLTLTACNEIAEPVSVSDTATYQTQNETSATEFYENTNNTTTAQTHDSVPIAAISATSEPTGEPITDSEPPPTQLQSADEVQIPQTPPTPRNPEPPAPPETPRTPERTLRETTAVSRTQASRTPSPEPAPSGGVFRDTLAREILGLVNAERIAHGIAPLEWSDDFAGTSRVRAGEIHLRFEQCHSRPDGSEWHTTVREAGINFRTIGENMARGGSRQNGAAWYTPKIVMESWMDSPGHRRNILNEEFELMGVGAFDLNGTRYYVQHFGTLR